MALLGLLLAALIGVSLGLLGGGGSILAVPLLVYVVGVASTHVAIGTGAIAVAGAALVNIVPQWRAGHVKRRCAAVFALSGAAGALAGSSIAKVVDGSQLLALFAVLMVVVGASMLPARGGLGDSEVQLNRKTALRLMPRLVIIGFGVGALSGFFGIGGGFLIVPGLMLATGMPIAFAVGTSLVAVFAIGAATAASYALSGLVDWPLALVFIAGAGPGGLVGAAIGHRLARSRDALRRVFALIVIAVGLAVLWRGLDALGITLAAF